MKIEKYSPKTIILPKQFMEEFLTSPFLSNIKEQLSGYNIVAKDCYVTPIDKSVGKLIVVESDLEIGTTIPIMTLNSQNLAGLIIEKDYSCFFVVIYATSNETGKKIRTGLFLGVLQDENILKWNENKKQIEIETCGEDCSALSCYIFREQTISTLFRCVDQKQMKNALQFYSSVLSQFLNIYGGIMFTPKNWKPK